MISVGLEMGNNAIKLAVLEGGRGAFKLRGFEVHRSDAKKGEAEDDIVSVVDAALKRLKVPRNQVVASIRAQDCAIREITVPFTDEDKIRKTVKYQAENYFTSMSIDDLIIEYSKFAEVDQKSKLMVAGIKKAHIERRLEFLQECGIDPVSIDLDVAALYNTLAHVGTFEGKGAVLIVDIEADTLRIGVVDGGKLRLARAVRMQLGSMRLEKAGGRAPAGGGGDPDDSGVFDTAAD
ncbi:MAG: pilus assembly protein PilM, partial [Planctomycetota bacterium]|nr:pilus assembly protein PilM [Planctomycetota bacterium]